MIPIDPNKVTVLIDGYDKEITRQAEGIQERLTAYLKTLSDAAQMSYVEALIKKGAKLITCNREEMAVLRREFDAILKPNKGNSQFRKEIIRELGYKRYRSDFYPEYFHRVGIKTCVYCNAQLCVTVEKQRGGSAARFQVDHYYSKDKYPCLSVALFNLYPSCGSCNNVKGSKRVHFDLYAGKNSVARSFNFSITEKEKMVAKYLTTRNSSDIAITFEEGQVDAGCKKHDEIFSITGIYKTQIDVVEELIMKGHIYDDTYKSSLQTQFTHLFKDESLLNRFIAGNYTDEADIHNRPLAKFTRDIALQLGLIKKK